MSKFKNPVLFSKHFNIDVALLDRFGLIDPFLDVDTQLFIDPLLLEKSSNKVISSAAAAHFKQHFSNFLRLLAISRAEGDAPWRNAERLLPLSEPPENGLGYGGASRSGSSRSDEVRLAIMRTAKEIITLGADDPEMISLMGFFEEGVGPDTISDFTTQVIMKQLAEITYKFCKHAKISVYNNNICFDFALPKYTAKNGKNKYFVLVPKDIVRELPMANDWSDVYDAINANRQIRDSVNIMLSSIAKPTVSDRKYAVRNYALRSPERFMSFLSAIKEAADNYDPNMDALAYFKMKSIISAGYEGIKTENKYDVSVGPSEIYRCVMDSIDLFRHHVENGNLWEELWVNGKPKKERAAQLLYYAISDAYCKAHDVDISPEANMGGGPVDFKFSTGYRSRVLVEMKRSSGQVKHGYEKQLEFYKTAAKSDFGIYVVIDYGNLGNKLQEITQIQSARRSAGLRASDIIVIDSSKKLSASKRN